MSARKLITDKVLDNVETKKLNPIFKEWLESLDMPWNDGNTTIEEFEYRSRDGFSAHDHNRGGVDLINITSVAYLIGSGEHFGLAVEDYVSKQDNPNATEEELFDIAWEYNSGEYDDVAYRVRVMYTGNNTVEIFIGYDTDAPYFRWNDKPIQEIVINFKNKTDLKKQLNKIKLKV